MAIWGFYNNVIFLLIPVVIIVRIHKHGWKKFWLIDKDDEVMGYLLLVHLLTQHQTLEAVDFNLQGKHSCLVQILMKSFSHYTVNWYVGNSHQVIDKKGWGVSTCHLRPSRRWLCLLASLVAQLSPCGNYLLTISLRLLSFWLLKAILYYCLKLPSLIVVHESGYMSRDIRLVIQIGDRCPLFFGEKLSYLRRSFCLRLWIKAIGILLV